VTLRAEIYQILYSSC